MNEFKIKKGLIINGSGSTILDIQGSQGQLFSVTDSLSGSLFSVNDISGMPILEAFSDDRVLIGTYNAEAIKVSGSSATITGSLFGTASYATQALSASFATSASYAPSTPAFPYTGSALITGSVIITGSLTVTDGITGSLFGTATTASYVTPYEGAWTAYTPAWTAASVNPVINNGTIEGYYKVIGKTCFVRGNIAMGSTTTFGSGEWYVSMPFTASHADAILMSATLLDNGSAWYNAILNGARAGFNHKSAIQYQVVGGTADSITPTAPFTWANGDRFIWNGSYEIL
jgi:hypothetical protein